jgi:uncharacterized protein YndB with AHSA1/START domain
VRKKSAKQSGLTRALRIQADAERVFSALTTLEGLAAWWTPRVSGRPLQGGDVRFEFEGLDEHLLMHVERAVPFTLVQWACLRHTDLPDWDGTKISFALTPSDAKSCQLDFHHAGLTERLDCYESCSAGWDHFLGSLVGYVERGKGSPFVGSTAHPRWTPQ